MTTATVQCCGGKFFFRNRYNEWAYLDGQEFVPTAGAPVYPPSYSVSGLTLSRMYEGNQFSLPADIFYKERNCLKEKIAKIGYGVIPLGYSRFCKINTDTKTQIFWKDTKIYDENTLANEHFLTFHFDEKSVLCPKGRYYGAVITPYQQLYSFYQSDRILVFHKTDLVLDVSASEHVDVMYNSDTTHSNMSLTVIKTVHREGTYPVNPYDNSFYTNIQHPTFMQKWCQDSLTYQGRGHNAYSKRYTDGTRTVVVVYGDEVVDTIDFPADVVDFPDRYSFNMSFNTSDNTLTVRIYSTSPFNIIVEKTYSDILYANPFLDTECKYPGSSCLGIDDIYRFHNILTNSLCCPDRYVVNNTQYTVDGNIIGEIQRSSDFGFVMCCGQYKLSGGGNNPQLLDVETYEAGLMQWNIDDWERTDGNL